MFKKMKLIISDIINDLRIDIYDMRHPCNLNNDKQFNEIYYNWNISSVDKENRGKWFSC